MAPRLFYCKLLSVLHITCAEYWKELQEVGVEVAVGAETETGSIIREWDPADRPQMTLIGDGPSTLAREHQFVCITGVSGSGKSSVRERLNELRIQQRLSPMVSIEKASSREIRAEEASGVVPFKPMTERDWFQGLIREDRSGLASLFVGLHPPYPEWDWWGGKLQVAPPTAEEIMGNFQQFTQLYDMGEIEAAVDLAILRKTQVVIELFPQDAAGWLRVFPNTRIAALQVDSSVMRTRIDERWGLDSIVSRARLLDGVSTPLFQLIDPDLLLSNNTEVERSRNVQMIEEAIRSGWG